MKDNVLAFTKQTHLVGYWPLKSDSQDYSRQGNHGIHHGAKAGLGLFDGVSNYIEVPPSPSLNFSKGDFTIAAWIKTRNQTDGVIGDLVSKYSADHGTGFSICVKSSAGGYNSQGEDHHLYFGVDHNHPGKWISCGHPNPTSNYVSNSMTAFNSQLYAATTDAENEADWRHVYQYTGSKEWVDCGQVGTRRTRGVGPMVVHDGKLYIGTWSYDWTRIEQDPVDYCNVYCYAGDQEWVDCGQPGKNLRLIGLASYNGKLYVGGDDKSDGMYHLFVHEGGKKWRPCADFPGDFFPHAMGVYHGKLYIGTGSIYSFDGNELKFVGTPDRVTQVHSLEVYQGRLYTGTWPEGKVFCYLGGEKWQDCGRLGDSIEVNALLVHNSQLYAGSIPRAEVYRYAGDQKWDRLARFYSPQEWVPAPVDGPLSSKKGVAEWTRVTSLTAWQGTIFAGIGSCTSSILDAPCDVRGEVFAMQPGLCTSYDDDIGPGYHHITAIRRGGVLSLFKDGEIVAHSIQPEEIFDISNSEPLKIGYGEVDYFTGEIRQVCAFNSPLNLDEVKSLIAQTNRGLND